MFIHHRREKLLHAIAYFTRNTRHCHTLKLSKLLHFLDFEHYRQTGRPVTGLEYRALPKGPVPRELLPMIESESEQKKPVLEIRETFDELTEEIVKRDFKAKKKFDKTYFTPRELEIMERLALFFRDGSAEVMSAYSHDPKPPWKKIYGDGEGRNRVIPYALALQAERIVQDEPTIAAEELRMLDETFQGAGLR